jgi:hypothetical protein
MKINKAIKTSMSLAAAMGSLALTATSVNAATIIWQTPVAATLDGTADIDNSGTLVYAFNYGSDAIGGTQTIDGVTFADVPSLPGSLNTTGFTKAGSTTDGGSQTNATAVHAGTTGDYQDLMSSTALSGQKDWTLHELTSGNEYLVQFWLYESRYGTQLQTITGGTNTSGSLALSVGHYVIGTFIADDTTQSITFSNDMFSALQLRQVPEPTTTALLGLGGLALILRRRK